MNSDDLAAMQAERVKWDDLGEADRRKWGAVWAEEFRMHSEVLADEVERLNGRVATLEGGIESFLSTGWYDATVGVHPRNVLRALLDDSHDQEGNHEQ